MNLEECEASKCMEMRCRADKKIKSVYETI